VITARFDPGALDDAWQASLDRLADDRVVERLWQGDHTVVQDDPTECADRMGWLTAPTDAAREWPRWSLLADEIVEGPTDQGVGRFQHVLVLGMGGSSLFPEVLARTFEPGENWPRITTLDTTDPAAVLRTTSQLDPEHTLVVAASKSGSTIETRSHLEHFWSRFSLGPHFAAITDPGSALEQMATERGFRAVVHGVPEIGGRFSALSAFGLFPAALMGLDGLDLIDTAAEAAEALGADTPVEHHLACQLGALMAVAAQHGRDRLTFLIDERFETFGLWLEQLIAESTGKHGVGILPVVGEPIDAPDPDSRLYVVLGDHPAAAADLPGPSVRLAVEEPEDLGAQVFLWELATTVAGIVLGINPFDQPDVESAKQAARAALAGADGSESPRTVPLDQALGQLREGDALVICAFVDPELEPELQQARLALGRRTGRATTLGLGPRFLHSTGQLHKGGADRQLVVQVLAEHDTDLPVAGESFTFGQLERAQADGDLAALQRSGKRAVRVPLAELLDAAV
jgi:transaldolase/glucose-6-phosphate isomerase